MGRRLRPGDAPPLVSVVVPVHDAGNYLRPALRSIARQDYQHLQVILVDDGSTDGSREAAQDFAAGDPRVLVVTQVRRGVAAARDAGAALATGKYLTFVDADDTLPRTALARMVETLERTGSAFAMGSMAMQQRGVYRQPPWARRSNGRRRLATSLTETPTAAGNMAVGTRLFRRDFWASEDLRFNVAEGQTDAFTMTRAMLAAPRFDVLSGVVYRWSAREDGASVSQRALVDPLIAKGRLRDLRSAAAALEDASLNEAGRHFLAEVFESVIPDLVRGAMSAEPSYWHSLSREVRALVAMAPDRALDQVSAEARLLVWLCAQDRRDIVESFFDYTVDNPHGYPFHVEAGIPSIEAPCITDSVPELDPRMLRLGPHDLNLRARLTGFGWESPTVMRIEGAAFVAYLDARAGDQSTELVLRLDGTDCAVRHATEPLADAQVDQWSDRDREDHERSAFRVLVDCEALVARARQTGLDGALEWSAEVDVRVAGVRREGRFLGRNVSGSAGLLGASWCSAGLVEAHWRTSQGLVVTLRPDVHALVGLSSVGDALQLEVASRTSPVRLRTVSSSGRPLPGAELLEPAGAGRWRGTLHPPAPSADGAPGDWTLAVEDLAGRRRPLLWAVSADETGRTDGVLPQRDPDGGRVQLRSGAAVVQVDAVGVEGDELELSGACVSESELELALVGPRSRTAWQAATPRSGRFTVRLRTHIDEWGWGARPLPSDEYAVLVRSGGGAEVPAGTAPGLHRRAPEIHAGDSIQFATHPRPTGEFVVRVDAVEVGQGHSAHRHRSNRDRVYIPSHRQSTLPVVLFESFKAHSAGDSPRAICEELLRRDHDLDLVWSAVDHSVPIPNGSRAVIRNTEEWYELLARARYLVINSTMPHWFRKQDDQVYLQTWHGTPLKKIAHDRQNMDFENWRHRRHLVRETASWDYLLSASEFCTRALTQAFRYQGKVLELGYPRNDLLSSPAVDQRRATTRARLGIQDQQRVVLYAPTWRDASRVGGVWRKVNYLDTDRVIAADADTVVLMRGHYHTIRAAETKGARMLDVTRYPDIADLYLAADTLVTDYSSVFFDFAILDRPIIFLVPDLEHYRHSQRGFYLDFEEVAPGPIVASTDEVISAIEGPDEYAEKRAQFRQRFAPYDDGHASARVVDAVFGGQ